MNMKNWNIELIEKTMLESVYNDKSKMKSMIDGAIDLYEKTGSEHQEVKNRIEILHQLKEKYQDK